MSTATKPPTGKKGGNILKDKRVQLGIAGAGILGLIVLLRGGGSAGAADSGQSVNTGTLDSTGTDSYNAISQLGQAWQDQWNQAFQGFSEQLGDISDQLGGVNGPTQTPTTLPAVTPVNGGAVHTIPKPPVKNTAKNYGWYRVVAGDSWQSIERKENISQSAISKLNGGLTRLFAGRWVKVRSGAGPKPK